MVKDPYKTLGINEGASADEIKRAYRKLAKECHPDLHPNDPNANQRMQEINEAYDLLTRPGGWKKQAEPNAGGWYGARQNPYGQNTYGQNPYGQNRQTWQYGYSAYQRSDDAAQNVPIVNPLRFVLRFVGALILMRVFFRLFGFGLFWFFI